MNSVVDCFILLLVLGRYLGNEVLKNRCYCKEELRLIDCSRANLMVVPKSVPLVNYTTLKLRHNLLVQVNFSVLKEQLPSLKMIGLRENLFDCKGFPDKTIFGVTTACEITVTRKTLKTNPKTRQDKITFITRWNFQ